MSRLAAATALLIAIGCHGGALISRSDGEEVQLEGGSPAAVTALGNAFADMVAETNRPVKAELGEADTPPDTGQKPDPSAITPKEQPQQETNQQTLPVTKTETAQTAKPAETRQAAKPPLQKATNTPSPLYSQAQLVEQITATVQLFTTKAEPAEAPSPSVRPSPSISQPETTAQQPTATQATTELTYNEPVAVAATRPVARPVAKPEKPTKPIKPVVKQQPKSAPRAQGNSVQNANTGTATGTHPKAKAKSGTTSARSSRQGNAAASNYKGQVYRKIDRKSCE